MDPSGLLGPRTKAKNFLPDGGTNRHRSSGRRRWPTDDRLWLLWDVYPAILPRTIAEAKIKMLNEIPHFISMPLVVTGLFVLVIAFVVAAFFV